MTSAVAGSRVRLVKGAYAEPKAVAHPRKADVDRSYARCLEVLMAGAPATRWSPLTTSK